MEKYIGFNTEERKKAKSKFEEDFFKLMSNSVFGKTMENLRNRVTVELVRGDGEKTLRKLTSDPLFAEWRAFGENLFGMHMHKDHILFNRPIYVGMCVRELSKTLLYDFYYNHMKPKYNDNCQLLYTDTDSLIMHIKCEDVYKDMGDNLYHYDTSNYPEGHSSRSMTNKKILGKFKDECGGKPIREVVCLRSKMYSILKDDDANIKRAKGTSKCVVKKLITHENYKDALFQRKAFKHGKNRLQSENHLIYEKHVNKPSLSPFDSKRWIEDDGVMTKAYGNKGIPDVVG